MAKQPVDFVEPQPYKGELVGTIPHWAAHGPGVYFVCRTSEEAKEVAGSLNAAFVYGMLTELRNRQ